MHRRLPIAPWGHWGPQICFAWRPPNRRRLRRVRVSDYAKAGWCCVPMLSSTSDPHPDQTSGRRATGLRVVVVSAVVMTPTGNYPSLVHGSCPCATWFGPGFERSVVLMQPIPTALHGVRQPLQGSTLTAGFQDQTFHRSDRFSCAGRYAFPCAKTKKTLSQTRPFQRLCQHERQTVGL